MSFSTILLGPKRFDTTSFVMLVSRQHRVDLLGRWITTPDTTHPIIFPIPSGSFSDGRMALSMRRRKNQFSQGKMVTISEEAKTPSTVAMKSYMSESVRR